MPPWRTRAVPRQAPGDWHSPAPAKNGVGRLPHEVATDAVVKKSGLRPW